jgi:multicomponent Na+:H+ antiporter subunit G
MELLRFILAAFFITSGLILFGIATMGLYRLKYILNRVHASAKCDTLAGVLVLIGVCIISGFNFTTLKIVIIGIFVWLTNPVSIFMISRAEVNTNPNIEDEVKFVDISSKVNDEEATKK